MNDDYSQMRPLIRLVILLTMLVLAAGIFWTEWTWVPRSKPVGKAMVIKRRNVIAVRRDFDWHSVSEEEMREFASFFQDRKEPKTFHLEEDVAPGETIIADIYEAQPGEFVFTKLTPTTKFKPDGSTVIMMHLESFRMSAGGEQTLLIDHDHEMPLRSQLSAGSAAKGGLYLTNIFVDVGKDAQSVHVKASGDFQRASQ